MNYFGKMLGMALVAGFLGCQGPEVSDVDLKRQRAPKQARQVCNDLCSWVSYEHHLESVERICLIVPLKQQRLYFSRCYDRCLKEFD